MAFLFSFHFWVGPNYLLLFQVCVDVFILGCRVEPLRFAPPFWVRPTSSSKFPDYIQALMYSTPCSHSTDMFDRPFNQFRIHQSCSLPFSNLKQVHDYRSGVHSPRYFHTTHSFNNYLHWICSLFQMLQPSIACCYVEIVEDLSLLHWFPQEEYSSVQNLPCLGALQFRLISEGFFTHIASPSRWGKTQVEFNTLTGQRRVGNHQYSNPHH